jgi:hypothetical protein
MELITNTCEAIPNMDPHVVAIILAYLSADYCPKYVPNEQYQYVAEWKIPCLYCARVKVDHFKPFSPYAYYTEQEEGQRLAEELSSTCTAPGIFRYIPAAHLKTRQRLRQVLYEAALPGLPAAQTEHANQHPPGGACVTS